MKRKFKLFATVASLCLCLALMAFGVYAATSVTYTASGTVSYDVRDVFVDFDLTIEQVDQPADHSVGYVKTEQSAVEALTFKANTLGAENAPAAYTKKQSYTIVNDKKAALNAADAAALKDANIALDFNEACAYRITIKVTSQEETKTLNIAADIATGTNLTNAWIAAKATNATSVDAKGNVDLVYYVVLEDASLASTGAWSIALTVTK